MSEKIKNYLGYTIIGALVVFATTAIFCTMAYSDSNPSVRTFSVSGEGEVVAVPDVATFNFAVITEGGLDVSKVQDENSKKINKAISFLKENGVDKKDIKTSNYNLSPKYNYEDCRPYSSIKPCNYNNPEIVGYKINQTVSVKIRDFSTTGEILSGIVQNGANSVSGINFEIDDPEALQAEARELAVKEARNKAKSVAKSAGFRVGKLISINEGYHARPMYKTMSMESFGRGGDVAAAPSIEPGSQEVKITVNLVYEIK